MDEVLAAVIQLYNKIMPSKFFSNPHNIWSKLGKSGHSETFKIILLKNNISKCQHFLPKIGIKQ